jgi:hypothetical protein
LSTNIASMMTAEARMKAFKHSNKHSQHASCLPT